jgi:lysophospholipase L1-like esterase
VTVRGRSGAVSLAVAVVAFLACASVASGAGKGGPVVTLIGDSVADRLEHQPYALQRLNKGFRLNLETRGCRRLATRSCVVDGDEGRPATVVSLASQLGSRLGDFVVIAVGYNDDPYRYGRDLDRVMRALLAEGVEHVVWLTLREARPLYAVSNAYIDAERRDWPMLTVADWNAYSTGRPDWFEADGVHLNQTGAWALAVFVHKTLRQLD